MNPSKEPLEQLEIENGNSEIILKSNKKQSIQATKHCFTWNNYTLENIEQLEQCFKQFKHTLKYVFQEEIGETTFTPHLQGSIWFKVKVRHEALKLPPVIHWEHMRNEEACIAYCQKTKTAKAGSVPYIYGFPKPLKLITPNYFWQEEILNIISNEPDDRTVHWYWSVSGRVGKSSFVKYLMATKNCVFIDEGKKGDLMNCIFNQDMDKDNTIVVFDIPRDNGNNVSYKSIESIKNGMIFNSKYETGYKLFNPPHLIVFANSPPDKSRLSSDRWKITQLDKWERHFDKVLKELLE